MIPQLFNNYKGEPEKDSKVVSPVPTPTARFKATNDVFLQDVTLKLVQQIIQSRAKIPRSEKCQRDNLFNLETLSYDFVKQELGRVWNYALEKSVFIDIMAFASHTNTNYLLERWELKIMYYGNLPDFKAKHLTLGTFEHAAGLLRIVTAALRSLPAAKIYYALLKFPSSSVELNWRITTEPSPGSGFSNEFPVQRHKWNHLIRSATGIDGEMQLLVQFQKELPRMLLRKFALDIVVLTAYGEANSASNPNNTLHSNATSNAIAAAISSPMNSNTAHTRPNLSNSPPGSYLTSNTPNVVANVNYANPNLSASPPATHSYSFSSPQSPYASPVFYTNSANTTVSSAATPSTPSNNIAPAVNIFATPTNPNPLRDPLVFGDPSPTPINLVPPTAFVGITSPSALTSPLPLPNTEKHPGVSQPPVLPASISEPPPLSTYGNTPLPISGAGAPRSILSSSPVSSLPGSSILGWGSPPLQDALLYNPPSKNVKPSISNETPRTCCILNTANTDTIGNTTSAPVPPLPAFTKTGNTPGAFVAQTGATDPMSIPRRGLKSSAGGLLENSLPLMAPNLDVLMTAEQAKPVPPKALIGAFVVDSEHDPKSSPLIQPLLSPQDHIDLMTKFPSVAQQQGLRLPTAALPSQQQRAPSPHFDALANNNNNTSNTNLNALFVNNANLVLPPVLSPTTSNPNTANALNPNVQQQIKQMFAADFRFSDGCTLATVLGIVSRIGGASESQSREWVRRAAEANPSLISGTGQAMATKAVLMQKMGNL